VPTLFEAPYVPWGTMLVLAFVIGVTLVFESHDDLGRHRTDLRTNGSHVVALDLDSGRARGTTWGQLVPGDVVLLRDRELVPADVLVLQTSLQGGMVYIETSGIDGETNLKIKRAAPEMLEHVSQRASWCVCRPASRASYLTSPARPQAAAPRPACV
jgi:phospholipid-transporting ATPase